MRSKIEMYLQSHRYYSNYEITIIGNRNPKMRSKNLAEAFIKNRHLANKGVTFINDSGDDFFLSYQQLNKNALCRLRCFQEEMKLQPGDKLIFQLEDNQEFVASFWACVLGGIIPVPLTFVNNKEVIKKLLNVWEIVNRPYVIMPAKLCKRIEKNLNETAQEQSVVFQDFASRCRTVETLKHWEEQHRDQEGLLYNVKSTDLVFIQFSSGSTGDPKGVMLTHENILTNIYDMSVSAAWTDEDKSLSWMPLTHDMGLIGLHITPLVLQCNQYLMSTFLFAFYPLTWMQKVSEYDISITSCPNFGYEHFLTYLNEKEFTNLNLSSLRIILNGAEPISYRICAHFLKALSIYSLNQNVILPVYGLAEGSLAITNNPLYEGITTHNIKRSSLTIGNKIKTITGENEADCTLLVDLGTPVGRVTLDIRNEKGESLPEETAGVLYIKGKNVTQGYYNNPTATKNCLTEDGWLNTGDLGFIKNNRLTIIGRQKEILFVNGNNYYSNDIERVAAEIKGVSMGKIGVCGIENVNQGCEDIVVFIQFKKSIEQFIPLAEQIKEKIRQQTGLQVKYVIPIKKLPLTTSGKVRRFVLREKFMKGEYNNEISDLQTISHSKEDFSSVQENTQGNKIERIILNSWQKNSRANKTIGLKENFLEAGGDSLLLAKVASDLAHAFQGKVSVTDFFAYPTVEKLASTINERLSASGVNLHSVKLNKAFLSPENTGRHLFNICIKKEMIDAIFQGNQDIKYLEQLLLTCYAFIIGKMTDQQEITFYISKNNQNTFLPCTIIPGHFKSLLDLAKNIKQTIDISTLTDNIVIEKADVRKAGENSQYMKFMLTRQTYKAFHHPMIDQIFDCIVSFKKDNGIRLQFSITRALKKNAAQTIINTFLFLMRKLAKQPEYT